MREILFKAKRIDNGEWAEGSYAYAFNEDENCHVVGIMKECHYIVEKVGNLLLIDKDTICQYTGLTDKNGNKIWENDVLLQKTTEQHWCQWECMGVVKYGEHDWNVSEYGFTSIGFYIEPILRKGNTNKIACGLNQIDINDEFYPIEVIGNIFDNPELLKGE